MIGQAGHPDGQERLLPLDAATPGWTAASWPRRLLAALLDLLIFSAIHGVFVGLVSGILPDLVDPVARSSWLLFALLQALVMSMSLSSPGCFLLGMRTHDPVGAAIEPDSGTPRRLLIVEERIRRQESWFTMLIGTLLLFEGSRILVRWTLWKPPIPLFGMETNTFVSRAVMIGFGLTLWLVAGLLLRVRREAVGVGLGLCCAILVSSMLSWSRIGPWAEEEVKCRRAFQGLPVKPGELEAARAEVPEFIVTLTCMFAVVLWLVRWQLIRRARREAGRLLSTAPASSFLPLPPPSRGC